MLVGGSVRDRLARVESKDYDLEVYGLEPKILRRVLETVAPVNAVGESFAVYKLAFQRAAQSAEPKADQTSNERFEIDVSIPRRESRTGQGHRGFSITGDPSMSFEEAARRRDFTINAVMCDPLTDELIDPFNGVEDFRRRNLRAVAADTFVEDSLRVLRGIQLAARFEMRVDPDTATLCRSIDLSDLPRERIWGEIEKLLMLAERPSIGLTAALELDVLAKLFPEIQSLSERQPALDRTGRALDEAVRSVASLQKPKRIAVMLSALCHQLEARETESILERLGVHSLSGFDVRAAVIRLVSEQGRPREFHERQAGDGDFRRLSLRVELDLLYRLAVACRKALDSSSACEAEGWFIEQARRLGVEHTAPAPLLLGRHLLELGFEAGPKMGEVLRRVYELQLDGKVSRLDEAIAAARSIGSPSPKNDC